MECVRPIPVAGSMMCEYRWPAMSTCCSASPEVDTAAFESSRTVPPASIFQPARPGGASLKARSPLTATSALRIPARVRTASASSAAYPFAIPRHPAASPGSSMVSVRVTGSRCNLR